ncbi:hypothetical protein WN55_02782 [Dufourea novaeangliae]|uniref:Uncharacterized protein n=1 Tax=Dufourea novaeangliae TaxID=178035 RepID=A0A154NXM8_DUFNO|nr:hypothetical protein WN55_02782 [Dufourea novaeangliae]
MERLEKPPDDLVNEIHTGQGELEERTGREGVLASESLTLWKDSIRKVGLQMLFEGCSRMSSEALGSISLKNPRGPCKEYPRVSEDLGRNSAEDLRFPWKDLLKNPDRSLKSTSQIIVEGILRYASRVLFKEFLKVHSDSSPSRPKLCSEELLQGIPLAEERTSQMIQEALRGTS